MFGHRKSTHKFYVIAEVSHPKEGNKVLLSFEGKPSKMRQNPGLSEEVQFEGTLTLNGTECKFDEYDDPERGEVQAVSV
jgi:hypothetical protein